MLLANVSHIFGSYLRLFLGILSFNPLNAKDGSKPFQVWECRVIFWGIVEALSNTVHEIVGSS